MKISHGTKHKLTAAHNGYGYATDRMATSLERLGHEWVQNDPHAPVQIWFDQPHHWKWNEDQVVWSDKNSYRGFHQYRIGYHPWESTKLKDDWVDRMNLCDEIWTPSALIAEWYREDGVTVPVHVYEHGVDADVWTPKKRKVSDTMNFLHCGAEAVRKGGQMTQEAFRKAFPDNDDVTLTMKMINPGIQGFDRLGKVIYVNKQLTLDGLVNLFDDAHVYVYPSRGEGFGLTPLQAMATGMPTITLPAWAPYRDFLNPNLTIDSTLQESGSDQRIHPGKMFYPKMDDIVDAMRYAYDNYDTCVDFALEQVPAIQKKYDWDALTKETFEGLEKRLK